MSYSSNRRRALDSALPISHRMSSARSCAVNVCEKFRVRRSVVIAAVEQACGVDLLTPQSPDNIAQAIAVLDRLRFRGLPVPEQGD